MDDMIRDGLVCGVNDDHIQKRLLSEPDGSLTLKRAIQLATAMETAVKDVAELQQSGMDELVHKVQPAVTDRQTQSMAGCFRCGANHAPAECMIRCNLLPQEGALGQKMSKCQATNTEPGQRKKSNTHAGGR